MDFTLPELAAISAVGAGLTWASTKFTNEPVTPILLGTGTVLYVIGVGVGSMRPPGGWLPAKKQLPEFTPAVENPLTLPGAAVGLGALAVIGATFYLADRMI